ncbi:MAG: MotA/TolQ/ExbB proton channel family protein [Motiliproteus sp.]|nr:MotA/TolQ/ExbB proton channel family protein [Motiliproteus sp.]MCW9054294.1 MotA/TolQ/ExbB proton channel family protein [Motiliproteus sp.]
MRFFYAAVLLLIPSLLLAEEISSFEQLLTHVKQGYASEQRINQQLLQHANKDLQQWQQLVKQTEVKLKQAENQAKNLRQQYDLNSSKLKQQAAELKNQLGDLENIYSNSRQAANHLHSILKSSLVSAEHPQLLPSLAAISNKALLTDRDLANLWHLYLEEMAATAKISTFDASLVNSSGQEELRKVVRIGPFSAASDGSFLKYLPGAGTLVELSRQPAATFRDAAEALQNDADLNPLSPIDPSRGKMLESLTQQADIQERVDQGGIIGKLILLLGVIGLLIVSERLLALLRFKIQIKRQQNNPVPGSNPLGQLMRTHQENQHLSSEQLQLKLDECLFSFAPRSRRGLTSLNIIATVTPLLGLLGTVTGMIDTFQSITLFGNGDPKIMSGGISQALVTTELGLAVSIPIILLHSHLSSRSNSLLHLLQKQVVDLIARQDSTKHA